MDLAIHFPNSVMVGFPYVWGIAHLAPRFEIDRTTDTGQIDIACFPDCADNVDLVLHLIRESTRIPGAWVTVNGRRLSSVAGVRDRLQCYRASLNEPDRDRYCTRRRAEQALLRGCQERSCALFCQFVCVSCSTTVPENERPPSRSQLEFNSTVAEVDWCPNLKVQRTQCSIGDGKVRALP